MEFCRNHHENSRKSINHRNDKCRGDNIWAKILNIFQTVFQYTARPPDTRILVPEKNCAAQNRASWGLYLCTKWYFFTKNRVYSRLLFKIRASWGYTYVLKGIFIDFFLAYLAIGTFRQLGIGMFGQLGPWAIGTFGQLEIVGSS